MYKMEKFEQLTAVAAAAVTENRNWIDKCGKSCVLLPSQPVQSAETEFLDEILTKVFRVFLLAIQSNLYSFALRFLFLQTRATSYSFYSALLYTVKEKRGKPDRKPHPPSLWFKKSIQKSQVWELSSLCPETSRKLYVHESGFRTCAH